MASKEDEPDHEPILTSKISNDSRIPSAKNDINSKGTIEKSALSKTPTSASNLSRRRKAVRGIRNHCAQFCLWWLLGVVILLVIILPLMYAVVYSDQYAFGYALTRSS